MNAKCNVEHNVVHETHSLHTNFARPHTFFPYDFFILYTRDFSNTSVLRSLLGQVCQYQCTAKREARCVSHLLSSVSDVPRKWTSHVSNSEEQETSRRGLLARTDSLLSSFFCRGESVYSGRNAAFPKCDASVQMNASLQLHLTASTSARNVGVQNVLEIIIFDFSTHVLNGREGLDTGIGEHVLRIIRTYW